MNNSIIVEHVSKAYGSEKVLKNVSMTCEPGKIYGIVGKNGSGKTVLFRTICGFAKPDSGSVIVSGKEVGKETDFPESLGMIIEHPGFLFASSGFSNLRYLARIKKKIGDDEIKETMRLVGLDWRLKKWVGRYSMGMRQRLGIAQAIMEDPDIIILDEPMNGLDASGVSDIRRLLLKLKEEGKTILLASHNEEDIRVLCDEVYKMEDGLLKKENRDLTREEWMRQYPSDARGVWQTDRGLGSELYGSWR